MKPPGYDWSCHACGAVVPAGSDRCPSCRSPAVVSADELNARHGKARTIPPHIGGVVFLGAYAVVIVLVLLAVAVNRGDMSTLLLVLPAMPWPFLGMKIFGPNWGLGAGTLAGLVFNGVIAFYLGAAAARMRNRRLSRLSQRRA